MQPYFIIFLSLDQYRFIKVDTFIQAKELLDFLATTQPCFRAIGIYDANQDQLTYYPDPVIEADARQVQYTQTLLNVIRQIKN